MGQVDVETLSFPAVPGRKALELELFDVGSPSVKPLLQAQARLSVTFGAPTLK